MVSSVNEILALLVEDIYLEWKCDVNIVSLLISLGVRLILSLHSVLMAAGTGVDMTHLVSMNLRVHSGLSGGPCSEVLLLNLCSSRTDHTSPFGSR